MPELLPCGYLVGDNMNIAISLKGSNIIDDYKSLISYVRTLITMHCPHSPAALHCCSCQSVSSTRQTHSNKPAAAALLLRAHAVTDRRTDIVLFHRPCSAYYVDSAKK